MVGQQNADTADTVQLRDIAFGPSMCGGDAALCQITLITSLLYLTNTNSARRRHLAWLNCKQMKAHWPANQTAHS